MSWRRIFWWLDDEGAPAGPQIQLIRMRGGSLSQPGLGGGSLSQPGLGGTASTGTPRISGGSVVA